MISAEIRNKGLEREGRMASGIQKGHGAGHGKNIFPIPGMEVTS